MTYELNFVRLMCYDYFDIDYITAKISILCTRFTCFHCQETYEECKTVVKLKH